MVPYGSRATGASRGQRRVAPPVSRETRRCLSRTRRGRRPPLSAFPRTRNWGHAPMRLPDLLAGMSDEELARLAHEHAHSDEDDSRSARLTTVENVLRSHRFL